MAERRWVILERGPSPNFFSGRQPKLQVAIQIVVVVLKGLRGFLQESEEDCLHIHDSPGHFPIQVQVEFISHDWMVGDWLGPCQVPEGNPHASGVLARSVNYLAIGWGKC